MCVALDIDVEIDDELVRSQKIEANTDDYFNFVGSFGKNIENEIKKRVGITTKVKVHAQDSLPKCEGGKINRILKNNEFIL
jgi:phenylacetate-CoA ligase